MSRVTIKSLLTEMREVVTSGQTRGPGWWIDKSIQLAALWQDLKDSLTAAEMEYKQEVVDLIEGGMKISAAERTIESRSEKYKMYKYLKGRDEIVGELIMIAKKRATIEQYD